MKKLHLLTSLILFFIAQHNCLAQVYEEPPKVALPSNENKLLIDKIIEATDYESYFNNYCSNYITKVAKKEKWSKERITKAKQMISISSFKYNIYNWSSGYSTSELKKYLELYEKDKKSKNFLIENPNIAKALDSKINQFITESQK